jgi:hypothetical protein
MKNPTSREGARQATIHVPALEFQVDDDRCFFRQSISPHFLY